MLFLTMLEKFKPTNTTHIHYDQVCHTKPTRRRSMRKITRAEFNKLVEKKCGLTSVRIRRKDINRYKIQSISIFRVY